MKGESDTQLDIIRSLKSAEDFSLATGIKCVLINENGETLSSDGIVAGSCAFCRKYQQLIGREIDCRHAHLYGSENALRFGGKYTYFCPLSLTHFTAPILLDGIVRGALVGGPVLLIKKDEFIADEILKDNLLSEEEIKSVRKIVENIPHITPMRVTALAEQLLASASMLSDTNVHSFAEQEMLNSQQSHISEYIHHLKTMGGDTENLYPIEKERELLRLISKADKKGAQRLLNELLGDLFFSNGQNFDVIKSRILELVVLLSRAALDGGANIEQIFGLNFNYLKEINQFRSLEPLCNWLTRIMVRFIDFVFDMEKVKHADAIYKSIQYLNEHFTEKVSLDDVAGEVYLSPAYFSKIFKEDMNISFKNYLNTLRIDKGKSLLSGTEIPLIDIAGLVGYEDQSYFSKVFKKLVGISPGKYRERRGKFTVSTEEIH